MMSTVMYCYWIDKNKLFDFAKQLSEFWKANYSVFSAAWKYKYEDIMKLSKNDEYHVDLQLFDIVNDKWLMRILSSGYFIHNNINQFVNYVEPCHYDDRTDIPENDLDNKKYAEQIDELINKKEYFIVPLIDDMDIILNYWKNTIK